ncbi:hypothetical protein [Pedobacter sp. MR2016-24]|uniref:hypothetical protein n=1 Tax=Pedobacter sp. MR2016-24 TaxID=2994466 RepID=UPI00224798DB|nr:hypothetical protein [Pedobacter sp. MR2016-24]MCX2484631.1 hypothetical protein [Pedobacter sp. MR2016-24]
MNFKKYFALFIFPIFLSQSCSKESIEVKENITSDNSITEVVRNFSSYEELKKFDAKRSALSGKEFTDSIVITKKIDDSKSIARGTFKKMSVLGSDNKPFDSWESGWKSYAFDFTTLENSYPHLLEFNVSLNQLSPPMLGTIFLTAGTETFPGNSTYLEKGEHRIQGSGFYFTANLNWMYHEVMTVQGYVVRHNVFRTLGTVSRESATSQYIIAHLEYIQIQ